jgi:hypothetical protein
MGPAIMQLVRRMAIRAKAYYSGLASPKFAAVIRLMPRHSISIGCQSVHAFVVFRLVSTRATKIVSAYSTRWWLRNHLGRSSLP